MVKRSYRQHCALARALDVVGERWSLLLVRELLVGPQRFKDLLASLRGIGTNLLATRLRELEALGLVETVELAQGVPAYGLTERGRGLEPAVVALARWGGAYMARPRGRDHWRARWTPLALRAAFSPERASGVSLACTFRVDDDVFHARVRDGTLESGAGPADDADLSLETDGATLIAIWRGERTPREAQGSGRLTLRGSMRDFERFQRLFAP